MLLMQTEDMGTVVNRLALVYDMIRNTWNRPKIAKCLSMSLLLLFAGSTLAIALNFLGFIPAVVGRHLPGNPFAAIQLAFTLVLAFEVIDLIFSLSESVSLAVRKQLEIMALIMLRDAFKDIGLLHDPISLVEDTDMLLQIAITSLAGFILFIVRGFFTKLQYIQNYTDMKGYVNAKKSVSLLLLVIFVYLVIYDGYHVVLLKQETMFFHLFYTCLIFTDIFLVLIGQYFTPSFHVTFRNSGYAAGTLLMRIALGAPHHAGALLCVFSGFYILGISWATARFLPSPDNPQEHATHVEVPVAYSVKGLGNTAPAWPQAEDAGIRIAKSA
jgi:hypothetical protein